MKKAVFDTAKNNEDIVSIYFNQESTDKFIAGHVLYVNEIQMLIGSIDAYGNYDGYVTRLLDDAFLVETNTKYTKKLSRLYKHKKQSHEIPVLGNPENLFLALLGYAQTSHKAVSVQLFNSGFNDVQGFVDKLTSDTIVLSRVDDNGEPDGQSDFSLNDVTSISCDSQEDSALTLLANLA